MTISLPVGVIDRPVILATGSRHWRDADTIARWLDLVASEVLHTADVCLIHGHYRNRRPGAPGADQLARAHAVTKGWPVLDRPADWTRDCGPECRHGQRRVYPGGASLAGKSWCPTAGPIRNQAMVDEVAASGYPAVCVGFVLPGSRGTTGCMDLARAADLRVMPVGRRAA